MSEPIPKFVSTMEAFLNKRDLVSWSLNEESLSIDPKKYVRTGTSTVSKNEEKFKTTREDVLPDGTRHGKYKCTKKHREETVKITASFRMGKLDGFFRSSTSRFESLFTECRAKFRDGVLIGRVEYTYNFFEDALLNISLLYRKGFPTCIAKGGEKFPLTWEKNTLIFKNKKYRNISFDGEEKTPHFFLFTEVEMGPLEKFCRKVYGTNDEGERVRIRIPVFH
nr:hypothetical protein [Marseillevirus cajuinensis]